MRHTGLIIILIFVMGLNGKDTESKSAVQRLISNTQNQFEKARDYQVTMTIELKVPGFRMPRKRYTVFFKQPDKLKIKSRGFGMLPKTGLFTSPRDNFDNLKNMRLIKASKEEGFAYIKGDVIIDSLKLKMPNEYAKLGFRPSVTVKIDTINWVINKITTELDTLKLVEITNKYKPFNNDYFMPAESKVQYYVKDAKLSSWLKNDITSIVGQSPISEGSDMVEGNILITYTGYIINEGIKNSLFGD